MENKKDRSFVIINLFIFLTMLISVPVTLCIGSRASRLDGGDIPYWQHIVTFTILSNIFIGIIALISAIVKFVTAKKQKPFPFSLNIWYLAAATAGMITFLTVIFFLAPMRAISGKSYFDMLLEPMFFLHFLNPVLAAISYMFFLQSEKIAPKFYLFATLPILVYAVPYLLCVVVFKIWPDFYGLTFGGRYYLLPLVFIAFSVISLLIAIVLSHFHNQNQLVENAEKV